MQRAIKKRATVILAMPNPLFRDLVNLALLVEGMEVLKIASCAEEAINSSSIMKPELILLDTELLKSNLLHYIKQLRKESPATCCILYSKNLPTMHVPYLIAGNISGLLCQQCGLAELVHCFQEVQAGQAYLTPYLHMYINAQTEVLKKASSTAALSKRELDILYMLAEGHTNDQVADRLCISYHTVVNHKRNMVTKLGLKGAHELLPFAISTRHPH